MNGDPQLTQITRGGCLSAFLAFIALSNGAVFVTYTRMLVRGELTLHVPTWALAIFAIAGVVNLVAAIGMWKWRRWGVYAFACVAPLALVINLVIHVPLTFALLGLLGPVILFVLVRPRWQGFR